MRSRVRHLPDRRFPYLCSWSVQYISCICLSVLCIKLIGWSGLITLCPINTSKIKDIRDWQKEKNSESRKKFRQQLCKKSNHLANATNKQVDVRTVDLIKHVSWRTRPHEIRVREAQNNKTISNGAENDDEADFTYNDDGLIFCLYLLLFLIVSFCINIYRRCAKSDQSSKW